MLLCIVIVISERGFQRGLLRYLKLSLTLEKM